MTPLGSPPFRREIIRSCPPIVPEEEKRTDRTGFVPLLVDRIPQYGVFGKGAEHVSIGSPAAVVRGPAGRERPEVLSKALCEACKARSDREYSDSVTKERNQNTEGSEGEISVGGGGTEQATEISPRRSRAEAGVRTKPEVAALRRAGPKAAGDLPLTPRERSEYRSGG